MIVFLAIVMNKNFLIGIGGGTGSGKTSLAKYIQKQFGNSNMVILEQDSYYKDLSHIVFEERLNNNFDHPSSIDFDLLYDHLHSLLKNEPVEIPIYDFSTHTRQ